jgi:opacity protein-like surface antigen
MTGVERNHAGAVTGARRTFTGLRFAAVGLFLLAPGHAAAGDMDWLRGSFTSASYSRWEGVNFGVGFGLTNQHTDFGSATSSEVAFILRNTTLENEAHPSDWTTLPADSTNGRNYGLFLGYNVQWDQLVLGVDAAYNRGSSIRNSASDTLARRVTTSDNIQHDVQIDASSTMELVDYATLRARAGYTVGQFLPYAFVGAAVGRFNYTTSATVTSLETALTGAPPPAPYTYGPITENNNKDNAIVGGFTVGLGVDVAILPNVFLRGEWEFVGFAQVNGIRTTINTGRVGVGVKF